MGRLRRYITAPKRYKNSRGFGVHSPFAFFFITRVLCERTPFYDYDIIRDLRQKAHDGAKHIKGHSRVISEKHAKMIFRVLCHFKPLTLLQIGSTYGVSTATALLYDDNLKVTLYNPEAPADTPEVERVELLRSLEPIRGRSFPMMMISDVRPEDRAIITTLLRHHLAQGGVAIVRNISRSDDIKVLWDSAKRSMEYGMTFTNGKIGFIVGFDHLPLQHFQLWF